MNGGAKPGAEPAERTPEPSATLGFHAHLEGASLWDLVQMECFARSHLVVEVTGEGGVGHLYFDSGRVVHAATARNRGVTAALEILGWTHGTFQASNRSWPTGGPTIDVTHESLLLNAAKSRDEQSASNLVAFPGPGRGIEAAIEEVLEDNLELMEIRMHKQLKDAKRKDADIPAGDVEKDMRQLAATMKTIEATSSAHPEKKPASLPKQTVVH